MRETGSNNETLKQKNRGLVLRLVTTGECTSRIGVAKYTGLSKMAATNIISQLIEEDILEEKETIRVKGKGRNPIQLDLSKRAPKLIGVNIASDICSVVLCDMHLRIIGKTGFYVRKVDPDKIMENICRCIDRVIKKSPKEQFWGIGVAAPGPVDLLRGIILSHSGFAEMENIPIVEILEEKYHMPVLLESRQNCAALAEKYYGNGHDTEDLLLVGIGEEIGSGVISHGNLRESASGMTPELGHMSIDMNGRECCCGRKGCLRAYIEGSVLRAEYAEATGSDVTFREICRAAEKGEEAADRILGEMTEKLACGLVNAVNLLGPQKVILGGEGFRLPEKYVNELEQLTNTGKLNPEPLTICTSALGEEAGMRSSAARLLMEIFEGELKSMK